MKQSKITMLTSIGAGLEYYDLVIYGLLAKFISQQFFPSNNPVTSLFATFGVLALGNLARPLGGTLFGMLGDRMGRKHIFSNTLLWMSLATFLMGIIPSFHSWGLTATLLFSLCRIMQCLFYGAELPGAMTMLTECIDGRKHGLHFGLMIAATGLGVSFGSLIIWFLTSTLSAEQMLSWGFRVPFWLGGGLAGIGFYIRRYLPETPVFLAMQKSQIKLTRTLVKKQLLPIAKVIGIMLFPASIISFDLIFPVYLHSIYHFSLEDIYLYVAYGGIWSVVLIPTLGYISDYVGRKPLFVVTAVFMIFFSLPVFMYLDRGTRGALLLYIVFIQTVKSGTAACYFALIPRAFDAVVRYTCTGFGYNIAFSLAAIVPILVNYFYGVAKNSSYVVSLFIILAVLAIISTAKLQYRPIDRF